MWAGLDLDDLGGSDHEHDHTLDPAGSRLDRLPAILSTACHRRQGSGRGREIEGRGAGMRERRGGVVKDLVSVCGVGDALLRRPLHLHHERFLPVRVPAPPPAPSSSPPNPALRAARLRRSHCDPVQWQHTLLSPSRNH